MDNNNNSSSIKLQKYFSESGVMSRRSAEEAILAGDVLLNGKVALITDRMVPGKDKVVYKGKEIRVQKDKKVYILLNKPINYICTLNDEKDRKCAFELVKPLTDKRVWTIGRLDRNSDGLIILTNDGELTNLLTHPKHDIPKTYRVKIKGMIDTRTIGKLSSPLVIDGYPIKPVNVTYVSGNERYSVLQMVLYEGRNRQIRKMCEMCGLEIIRLTRIAIGDIQMGDLGVGKCRFLTDSEVAMLYNKQKGGNKNA